MKSDGFPFVSVKVFKSAWTCATDHCIRLTPAKQRRDGQEIQSLEMLAVTLKSKKKKSTDELSVV
jgi:hypothetical protein